MGKLSWKGPSKSPWMQKYGTDISETVSVPISFESTQAGIGGFYEPRTQGVGEIRAGGQIVVDPAKGDAGKFLEHELRHVKENAIMPIEEQNKYAKSPYWTKTGAEDFMENILFGVKKENLPNVDQIKNFVTILEK